VSRYRCVDAQRAAGFPVAAACQAAGVARSAYYAWVTRTLQGPSDRHRQEARLVGEIRRIHAHSHGAYGAPRVHAELGRRGWAVNHKRVERLMRTHGIVGYRPRRRRSLTKSDVAQRPRRTCWAACLTPTGRTWPGAGTSPTSPPTRAGCTWPRSSTWPPATWWATRWAPPRRGPGRGRLGRRGHHCMPDTIFHADRGSEYTSSACIQACQRLGCAAR
jgi:putative transposase